MGMNYQLRNCTFFLPNIDIFFPPGMDPIRCHCSIGQVFEYLLSIPVKSCATIFTFTICQVVAPPLAPDDRTPPWWSQQVWPPRWTPVDNGDNWGGVVYSLQQEMTADPDSGCPGARTTQNQDERLEVRAGRLLCRWHFVLWKISLAHNCVSTCLFAHL